MDFFIYREGGLVIYQVFLLSPLQQLNISLEKYKSPGKAVEVTVNSKEENLRNFV